MSNADSLLTIHIHFLSEAQHAHFHQDTKLIHGLRDPESPKFYFSIWGHSWPNKRCFYVMAIRIHMCIPYPKQFVNTDAELHFFCRIILPPNKNQEFLKLRIGKTHPGYCGKEHGQYWGNLPPRCRQELHTGITRTWKERPQSHWVTWKRLQQRQRVGRF